MSAYDQWSVFLVTFSPVFLTTFVASFILGLAFLCTAGVNKGGDLILIVACAFLGSVTGLVMGNSREPSVAAVLPALLTTITALAGYAFSKDSLVRLRPVVPYCVLAVILCSYHALNLGAKVRSQTDRYREDYDLWKVHYEKVDLEVEKALQFRDYGLKPPADK